MKTKSGEQTMIRPQKYSRSFRYGDKDILFTFWLMQEAAQPPDTIVFLGAGQVGNIPQWVATTAGTGVVAVGGLPHWEAHPDGEDTAQFAAAYVQAAFDAVTETFGVAKLHILAESQAVPATVILARTIPDRVHNIVLVRPLGFTPRAFGSSEQARLRAFRRRLVQTALQLIHHPRNVAIGFIMLRAMFREPSWTALNKKYAAGISYDLIEDCRQVIQAQQQRGQSLTLLLAEKDRLFPPKEVLAALAAASVDGALVTVVPRLGHASLATPSSKALLKQALDIARAV